MVAAYSKNCVGICLEVQKGTTKILGQDSHCCQGRDSNMGGQNTPRSLMYPYTAAGVSTSLALISHELLAGGAWDG